MSNKSKQHVYVSSSTGSDPVWIRDLADALSRHGIQPWPNERELMAGEAWQAKLEEALRNSDAILFVLTGDSRERTNVFFELGFAKALGKQSIFIVPENQDISWIPTDLRDEEIVVRKAPDATAAALIAALHPSQEPVSDTIRGLSSTERGLKVGEVDFMMNLHPRLPCVLLLDSSGSMAGQPIEDLNKAISAFIRALTKDDMASRRTDLAIISFGSEIRVLQDFTRPDEVQRLELEASGVTMMGQAIETALGMVTRRRSVYRAAGVPYYRPWIILITDGSPTDFWEGAAQKVRQGVAEKKFAFFAVAVENADMEILARIAPPNSPPHRLRGLNFDQLFLWLSSSISRVASSNLGENVELPSLDWSSDI
jgi:uncharacterized protein YegL